MDEASIPDDLMRPGEATKLLGLHLATLYRWMDAGKLAFWRVGRQRRVSRADVLALVTRGRPRRESVPLPPTAAAVARQRAATLATLEKFGLAKYVR